MQATKQRIQPDQYQQEIIDDVVVEMSQGQNETSIGGLAGTGKTTIASYIIEGLKDRGKEIITLCPTGKAANVLRNKGVSADTIHSAIYNFKGKYKDFSGRDQISWENKDEIRTRPDMIMVDESSMVNANLANDLRALNVPIIWVGDHGQLPPVGKDPGIMRHPDYVLKKNYRQGKSEIVDYALAVRDGIRYPTQREVIQYAGKPWRQLIDQHNPDQAILGFNTSRVKYNQLYRKIKGLKGMLNVGEKIICVNNNRRLGFYNGMQLIVKDIFSQDDSHIIADVASVHSPEHAKTVNLTKSSFNSGTADDPYITEDLDKEDLVCDYGYGITCHKSQGSEWDKVLVFNQSCQAWDQKRWLYTAATRAAKELIVVG